MSELFQSTGILTMPAKAHVLTKKYATHPVVKLILLYVFAYSVINDKLACLFAVALFTVVEVREFITDSVGDEIQQTLPRTLRHNMCRVER